MFPVIASPKSRIVAIGTWALDLPWALMILGGGSRWFDVAAVGFLCTSTVCVIAHSGYHRRKAAGLYNNLTPRPWSEQIW